MNQYVRRWEQSVMGHLKGGTVTQSVIENHLRHILWLQHERLVHLMVFLFCAMVMLGLFVLTLFTEILLVLVLLLTVLVVTAFYALHYYFLENTVQRWYKIADDMATAIQS